MNIKTMEDFEEYEPYCDVCLKDFNDVRELDFGGYTHGVDFRFCIDCRKELYAILAPTILNNPGDVHV